MTLLSNAPRKYTYILFCLILMVIPTYLWAECQVTLEWDPNGETPEGYRLYERVDGEDYNDNHYYDVSNESSATVFGLEVNSTYHFVVRAYAGANESADSNEATYECTTAASGSDPNPPSTPTAITPEDTAMEVGLEPTLTCSEFSDPDPGDRHAQTRWQIFRLDNDELVYDVVSNSKLTSMEVPTDVLEPFTAYYWSVSHYSQNGGISEPSRTADFTTSETDSTNASLVGGGSGIGGSSDGLGVGCFIQSLFK